MSDKNVLLINGPNLNLLGTRQPEIYGSETLADVEQACKAIADDLGMSLDAVQNNSEGELIDVVHAARDKYQAIIINPGAYTHTSVALRDALSAVEIPVFEVHISNIHSREEFRHQSYISGIAVGVICGLGTAGYAMALEGIAGLLSE